MATSSTLSEIKTGGTTALSFSLIAIANSHTPNQPLIQSISFEGKGDLQAIYYRKCAEVKMETVVYGP
jgi:hypothetical protein